MDLIYPKTPSSLYGDCNDCEDQINFILKPDVRLLEYSTQRWWDVDDKIFVYRKNVRSPIRSKEAEEKNLLPREDCPLFGYMPKMRELVLVECDKCGKLLMPCALGAVH